MSDSADIPQDARPASPATVTAPAPIPPAATATRPVATATPAPAAAPTVHEAYAFACMKCGHGWEQDYEIEHHRDGRGQPFIVYTVRGERVPSPLSSPTCLNCGGHVVRIMRSGQVSSVLGMMDQLHHRRRIARRIAETAPGTAPAAGPVGGQAPAGAAMDPAEAAGPSAGEPATVRRGLWARLMAALGRREG
ncbi:hypothetical protein ACN20G_15370 [Streptomyces sp. BI20]|uniref:hypothetical protein n=1 Tax=Streptomyces sp. BI20 TaxID=3403460 RepID=UPI003C718836